MAEAVKVESYADGEIDRSLDSELRELLSTCFPKDPSFKIQRYWKEPPLRHWLIRDAHGRPVAHAAVHRRTVGTSGGDLIIGGVGDVCVHGDHRGRGYVRALLADAHAWLTERKYPFAMLFGEKAVYSSSGYVNIDNPLRYRDGDQDAVKVWDIAMVRPITSPMEKWPSGEIDLRGLLF
jgi:hypothetical protein